MKARYTMRLGSSKSGGGPVYRCRDKPFLCAEFVTLGTPRPVNVDLILSDESFEGSTPVEVKPSQRVLLPGSKFYRVVFVWLYEELEKIAMTAGTRTLHYKLEETPPGEGPKPL